MKYFKSKSIWGIFLIIIGLIIILRVVFNIYLPIIRPLFGLFLIYLGIDIVFGRYLTKKKPDSSSKE